MQIGMEAVVQGDDGLAALLLEMKAEKKNGEQQPSFLRLRNACILKGLDMSVRCCDEVIESLPVPNAAKTRRRRKKVRSRVMFMVADCFMMLAMGYCLVV